MLNKFMKRGGRKVPKSDAIVPCTIVNLASRPPNSNPNTNPNPNPNPNSAKIEALPLFREVSAADRNALLLRKLHICFVIFDLTDPLKFAREKEAKRQTLLELVDFIQSGNNCIDEIAQEELVKSISMNIFRCLPPLSHRSENLDPEEEDTFLEPQWPHLQIVYELLLRYIVSSDTDIKIAKRYIDHSFVSRLVDLFDSEDFREREYLKTILHRIYGKFMVHRPFIRKAINNVLYRFIFETERHPGIGELLEILGSIINGFAIPMKEEHKLLLARALIPLHKPKSVGSYHQQLSYCVTQFIEKDYKLADVVVRGLLKYWPVTNCQKEVLFLAELEEVLEATQSAEFQKCMVMLFKQIGRCLNSSHFQVAERSLYLWNNDHIVGLIAQNRHVILPIIFEALEKNMRSHWNQAIHGLTSNVRKMFLEMDSELFQECQNLYIEKQAKAKSLEEQRVMAWRQIEAVLEMKTANDDMVLVN